MSKPIDISPLMNGADGQGKRKLQNALFGIERETDYGLNLNFPDGSVEMSWSIEECEHFMEIYLSNERADSRWQNKRRWNYAIWRFIMDLYGEGLRHEDIADKVNEEFAAYRTGASYCTKYTVKGIIGYRGWKVAKRMKHLLSMEKAEMLLSRRRNAAVKAEESELGVVDQLRKELEACVSVLATQSPVDSEYNKIVASIKSLKEIIASISGLDSIRKIEVFKEQQNIKIDMNSSESKLEKSDPKTMKPTIISE
jgi:hypothetical protein